jgi:hypothetical protein
MDCPNRLYSDIYRASTSIKVQIVRESLVSRSYCPSQEKDYELRHSLYSMKITSFWDITPSVLSTNVSEEPA